MVTTAQKMSPIEKDGIKLAMQINDLCRGKEMNVAACAVAHLIAGLCVLAEDGHGVDAKESLRTFYSNAQVLIDEARAGRKLLSN